MNFNGVRAWCVLGLCGLILAGFLALTPDRAGGASAPERPAGACDPSPVLWPANGHYYLAVCAPEGINWQAASDAATAMGGHLATATSAAENNFIFTLIDYPDYWTDPDPWGNVHGPWLGGLQPPGSPEPAGGWQWVTGEPWDFTNWNWDEPNNSGSGEDRLAHEGRSAMWNDYPSTAGEKGYVVEWETDFRMYLPLVAKRST